MADISVATYYQHSQWWWSHWWKSLCSGCRQYFSHYSWSVLFTKHGKSSYTNSNYHSSGVCTWLIWGCSNSNVHHIVDSFFHCYYCIVRIIFFFFLTKYFTIIAFLFLFLFWRELCFEPAKHRPWRAILKMVWRTLQCIVCRSQKKSYERNEADTIIINNNNNIFITTKAKFWKHRKELHNMQRIFIQYY